MVLRHVGYWIKIRYHFKYKVKGILRMIYIKWKGILKIRK